MAKLLDEIKYDVSFVKSHSLQPKWYKFLKVLILIGAVAAYWRLFGLAKAGVFLVVFIFLSLLVHLLYRAKTDKWQQTWLDFIVVEKDNEMIAQSIGKFYYSAIVLNAIISVVISQVWP